MARRTLQDISQATGFAISTISGVLNNRPDCFASKETRQRIHEAVRRLGYRPNYFAQALRNQSSRIIGIAGRYLPGECQARQCHGVQKALRKRGYITALVDIDDGIQKALEEFQTIHADGVLVYHDRDDDVDVLGPENVDIPLILVGSRACPGVCSIVIDRGAGMEALTRHLIELGHRRIVYATRKFEHNRRKYEGYAKVMREAGLEEEIKAFDMPDEDSGNQNIVSCRPDLFLHATAVVTSGDRVALEVIAGLQREGVSVPEQCSVVGFGDRSIARACYPALTTAHLPRKEFGEVIAEMFVDLMNGKEVPNRTVVPVLVIRESSAPPPKE